MISEEQIREVIKRPDASHKNLQAKVKKHQDRLRFHSEPYLDSSEITQPVNDFLSWVRSLLPKDKYNIFVSLFKYPTPVIDLTEKILSELYRVFDGRNPVFNYQFNDTEKRDDWEWYRQEKLHEPEIWKDKGWSAFKGMINSFLVVDMPLEQSGELPEPYFYWLKYESVIDYHHSGHSDYVDWIIFPQGKDVAVIDDFSYRLFSLSKNGQINLLLERPHNLGFCPVAFFWHDYIGMYDMKKSPLTSQLGNLDHLLFYMISKRHLDMYGSYPIYWSYEEECNFENLSTGEYCDGGFLRDRNTHYILNDSGSITRCPKCGESRLNGAGSRIEVPKPTENVDMREPVGIVSIDASSLEFNVSEQKRLREEIYNSVIGTGGTVQEKTSINEMQVSAGFENRTGVLNNFKVNWEKAMKFVDDTICKLRYGDSFIQSSISLGTEWYIATTGDLYQKYKTAKENGASDSQLDAISDQIIATENRNNPLQLQRMLILRQLEPYRHYTREELMTLNGKGLLDASLLDIKINFMPYIDRFERENINIIEFGSNGRFDKKIETILNTLKSYGTKEGGKSPEPTTTTTTPILPTE